MLCCFLFFIIKFSNNLFFNRYEFYIFIGKINIIKKIYWRNILVRNLGILILIKKVWWLIFFYLVIIFCVNYKILNYIRFVSDILSCNMRKLKDYDTGIGESTTTISPLGSPQPSYRSSTNAKINGFFSNYLQVCNFSKFCFILNTIHNMISILIVS